MIIGEEVVTEMKQLYLLDKLDLEDAKFALMTSLPNFMPIHQEAIKTILVKLAEYERGERHEE